MSCGILIGLFDEITMKREGYVGVNDEEVAGFFLLGKEWLIVAGCGC